MSLSHSSLGLTVCGNMLAADLIDFFACKLPLAPASASAPSPASQASLTKVVATTAAVAILHDTGHLDLNDTLASEHLLGAAFGAGGKASVTSLNCLLHNTGYPSDPHPNYWVCNEKTADKLIVFVSAYYVCFCI